MKILTLPYKTAQRLAGTVFPCSLYLIWVSDDWYLFYRRVKIGISENVPGRLQSIRNETGLNARVFVSFPIPFTKRFEKGLLHATRHWKQEMPFHAGYKEWRQCFNLITALLAFLYLYAEGLPFNNIGLVVFAIIILPLPLDYFILWLLTVSSAYAFLGGLLWVAFFIIQQIV